MPFHSTATQEEADALVDTYCGVKQMVDGDGIRYLEFGIPQTWALDEPRDIMMAVRHAQQAFQLEPRNKD